MYVITILVDIYIQIKGLSDGYSGRKFTKTFLLSNISRSFRSLGPVLRLVYFIIMKAPKQAYLVGH